MGWYFIGLFNNHKIYKCIDGAHMQINSIWAEKSAHSFMVNVTINHSFNHFLSMYSSFFSLSLFLCAQLIDWLIDVHFWVLRSLFVMVWFSLVWLNNGYTVNIATKVNKRQQQQKGQHKKLGNIYYATWTSEWETVDQIGWNSDDRRRQQRQRQWCWYSQQQQQLQL